MSTKDGEPYYDITEGDWRVTATPTVPGDARIELAYKGQPFKSFDYPAYRVWNIPAHLHDIVADFESGMDMANWSGFPSVIVSAGDRDV